MASPEAADTGATKSQEVVETIAKGTATEDLAKLSIAELKKRLFWVGASMPSGHIEKTDLVHAVKLAEEASAKRPVFTSSTADTSVPGRPQQESARSTVPELSTTNRSSREDEKEQNEVVRMFLLSEEELKTRIKSAGGDLPEGDVSKHYLVAALRSSLQKQKQKESPSLPKPPPVLESDRAIEEPSQLTVCELRRKLHILGVDIPSSAIEREDLVTLLRGASKPCTEPSTSMPAPAEGGSEVMISDADMIAQMEEMQKLFEAQTNAPGSESKKHVAPQQRIQSKRVVHKKRRVDKDDDLEEVEMTKSTPPPAKETICQPAQRTSNCGGVPKAGKTKLCAVRQEAKRFKVNANIEISDDECIAVPVASKPGKSITIEDDDEVALSKPQVEPLQVGAWV